MSVAHPDAFVVSLLQAPMKRMPVHMGCYLIISSDCFLNGFGRLFEHCPVDF